MADKKNSAEATWERCLNYIREQIEEKPFSTWFSAVKFVKFEDNRLLLSVPTRTVYAYIDEQYAKIISEALVREFGQGVKLAYKIGPATPEPEHAGEGTDVVPTEIGPLRGKETQAHTHEPQLAPRLNPNYTFENYIEGNSNKLARSVGLSIAQKPKQKTFNPFFLFGDSGVGKTHLINAIGIRLKENFPFMRVLYVGAQQFMVQFTESQRKNNFNFNDFIHFYQTIDVLIIDDIQEIAGKAKTQQAFFHIFNHLQQNGRQIIMSCDRPPALLEGMEERLLSRFRWGLVAEIEKPDTKLRLAILKSKIARDGLKFPTAVVNFIAANATDNIRDLEGIINSIMAYSIVYNCAIDLDLAERVVKRSVNMEKKSVTIELILNKVAQHYGLRSKDLCSKSRKQAVASARQVAIYLAKKYTGLSSSRIGASLGGRDHSTVLHSCNVVERHLNIDKTFRRELEDIETLLQQ